MNLQLNEPWLTDKKAVGGCAAAPTADFQRKPDIAMARDAGNHSHLELTLGMPSSYSSSPDHDTKGRTAAQAAFFTPHGATVVADKSTTASGTHAARLIYQMPGSSSSSGLGAKRWFSETASAPVAAAAAAAAGVGFVHPWSLAARQEKAVLEQAARNVANNQPSAAAASSVVQQPPVVGWPPIRTYRKNVITNPRMQKNSADCDEKEAKKSKPCEEEEEEKKIKEEPTKPSSKFVKVNMEGFAVGRKIDLLAHDGYDSLSSALHKMFDNFLSVKNAKMTSEADKRQSGPTPQELVLLYEDHEGDRMLVGDVPWEMFVSSVKRLYISINPKSRGSVDEDKEKVKREGEAAST